MGLFLYVGASKCGKSTLLRKHVYRSREGGPFLIVDRDLRRTWLGPVFTSVRAFRDAPTLANWSVFQNVPACEVLELAIDLGGVYVDEEVQHAVIERRWRPWGREPEKRTGHPLYAILHEGRHLPDAWGVSREVSAMVATRAPANLPGDLTALCTGVYLGRLPGWRDAKRAYDEGWVPEADGPKMARHILGHRGVGEFSYQAVSW